MNFHFRKKCYVWPLSYNMFHVQLRQQWPPWVNPSHWQGDWLHPWWDLLVRTIGLMWGLWCKHSILIMLAILLISLAFDVFGVIQYYSWTNKHIQRSFFAWTCGGVRGWADYKWDGFCKSKLPSMCIGPIPVFKPPINGARREGLPLGYLEKLIGSCSFSRSPSDPTAAGPY